MLSNMTPSQHMSEPKATLYFHRADIDGGYGFDADPSDLTLSLESWDEENNLTVWRCDESMPAEFIGHPGVANLARLIFDPTFRADYPEIGYRFWDATWTEPATGTCPCGREVELYRDYGHGIDCRCGRTYNMSGQELAPRSQWDDRYDEDSTGPYWAEFGHEDY
jgi:hypothetical protein